MGKKFGELTSWKSSARGKAHFVEKLSSAGRLVSFANLTFGGKR